MNETIKTLMERRSCRSFKPEQITDVELKIVLDAGMHGPTGANKQTPFFIAVQNKELRDKIRIMNARIAGQPDTADPYYGAPTVILVIARSGEGTPVEDGSLALGNMLNAAYAIGLGGGWVHREREMFESDEGKQILKDLGIEGNYIGVGGMTLGYPAEAGEVKERKADEYYTIVK